MHLEEIAIVSEETVKLCERMLARHGQKLANLDFEETIAENSWKPHFLTVRFKGRPTWQQYVVGNCGNDVSPEPRGSDAWISELENDLKPYFGIKDIL